MLHKDISDELIKQALEHDARNYEPSAAAWDALTVGTAPAPPPGRARWIAPAGLLIAAMAAAVVGLARVSDDGSTVSTPTLPAEVPADERGGAAVEVPGAADSRRAGGGQDPVDRELQKVPRPPVAVPGGDLVSPPGGGNGTSSSSGSSLFRYLTTRHNTHQLVYVNEGSEGSIAGAVTDERTFIPIGLTPTHAVYAIAPGPGQAGEVVVWPLDNVGPTTPIRRAQAALLSGDDTRLAYVADDGRTHTDIVVRGLGGGAEKRFPLRDGPWPQPPSGAFPHPVAFAGDTLVVHVPLANSFEVWSVDTASATSLRQARRIDAGGKLREVVSFDDTTIVARGPGDRELLYVDPVTGATKSALTTSNKIVGRLWGDGHGGIYNVATHYEGALTELWVLMDDTWGRVALDKYDGRAAW